jgi:hypothetical protein
MPAREEDDEWVPTAEEVADAEAAEAEAPYDDYDERTAANDAAELQYDGQQEDDYDEEEADPQHRQKKPKLTQGHSNLVSYICN